MHSFYYGETFLPLIWNAPRGMECHFSSRSALPLLCAPKDGRLLRLFPRGGEGEVDLFIPFSNGPVTTRPDSVHLLSSLKLVEV